MTTLVPMPCPPAHAPLPAVLPGIAPTHHLSGTLPAMPASPAHESIQAPGDSATSMQASPLAPSTYALDGVRRSENSELTEKSEHSLSGAILKIRIELGARTDTYTVSKATSKMQAAQDMKAYLADADTEVSHLKSDAVWPKMCAKLTTGWTTRHNDSDANIFLFRAMHRNVHIDKGYPTKVAFYQFLSGDPDATDKSLRNYFDPRFQLGKEAWGAEEGKAPKVAKPVVETVAIYLGTVPARIASAVATDVQIRNLADAVNKASDAVAALMARMDAAKVAADTVSQTETETEQTQRTGTDG